MDEWEKFHGAALPEKKKKLNQLKYGTYYRCRLHPCEKSL